MHAWEACIQGEKTLRASALWRIRKVYAEILKERSDC